MNISINKDIERYKESIVMGLTAKQLICSVIALALGAGIVLSTYKYVGLTVSVYIAIPVVAPIALNGTEAYVSSTDSAAWYLAQNIVTEIVRRTSTKYNGVFSRPSLYVLKNTKMPAVLVELGYITNYEDNQRMINEPYQFAYGIYVGLLNYLGLKQ